jgi:pimeloyl-ACP methyl ester carboxylesterase
VADIDALDLANKDLTLLDARLLLIHGYDDSIIPYTESIALAAALPKEQARLYLVDGLAHVDLEPGLRSRFRLWRAIHALLVERDSGSGPPP